MAPLIGYYAHHHGSGHLHRCRTIAEHLAELGHPARILSSAPGADVPLPLDTADDPATEPDRDVDAHGTLHYVPLHRSGLTGRMGMIAEWIARHRPAVMYVDVSVEVSLLARLMGVPVVGIAMPGRRDDPAHPCDQEEGQEERDGLERGDLTAARPGC